MASLMFLVSPCASLSTMVKHSGLTGCPVVDVCKCMGEGALRCSLYLSPSVHPQTPPAFPYYNYSAIFGKYQYFISLTFSLGPDEVAIV